MKFLNIFRENTLRLIFTLIALYCVIIAAVGFIQNNLTSRLTTDECTWANEYNGVNPEKGIFILEVIPDGVTDKVGIKNGDVLLEINGKPVNDVREATIILNEFGPDDKVDYKILRNNQIYNFTISVYKLINLPNIIFSFLGLGFLIIGFLVGYSKPKELTSQIFFFLGCSAGLGFNIIANHAVITGGNNILTFSYLAGIILFFPLFIHFSLTYPIKFESSYRRPLLISIYSFIFLLLIADIFLSPRLGTDILKKAFNYSMFVYLIFGITFFIQSYVKLSKLGEYNLKKPLKIILIGLGIGALGFGYLYGVVLFLNPSHFITNSPIFLPIALVLAIPIAFGYSIFRYKILDTEFIVKRGIVFGFITAFIIGLYLVLVYLVDSFSNTYFTENRQVITVALIVVITFTFDFVNKKAKRFVDKQFYRERYNYRKSLLMFSEELPYLNDFDEILNKIGSSVKSTIGVKRLNIWIKDHSYFTLMEDTSENGPADNSSGENNINIYEKAFSYVFKNTIEPKYLYDINLENEQVPEEYKKIYKDNGIILSVPITLKGELKGALNFGEKLSGKTYSDEDIDLLKTLASQCAIALENSRLQKEEVSKNIIEEELQIANRIQMDLLPKKDFNIEGLDISGSSLPAKTIGGDFYDLIRLDSKKVLTVVADVSGKGIPAALYMSKVQAMIQFAARIFDSPRDILLEVNKQIINKIDKKSFITIIIGLFDMQNNVVKICRAGHNPLLYHTEGTLKTLENKGLGIGVGTNEQFESYLDERQVKINPGDLFVFYSDGLTEAMNKSKDLYGVERISDIIEETKDRSAEEIKSGILRSIQSFRQDAEQSDDETIVVVKVD